MTRIATLRCPCVHDDNYSAVLRTIKKLAAFGPDDVRYNPNVQKPNHWVVYIDVHAFLDPIFGADFFALEGKECLKVFLSKANKAYVLVGIGKSQEECDAEVAALQPPATVSEPIEAAHSDVELAVGLLLQASSARNQACAEAAEASASEESITNEA